MWQTSFNTSDKCSSNELTTDFSRDADIIKPGLGKILALSLGPKS